MDDSTTVPVRERRFAYSERSRRADLAVTGATVIDGTGSEPLLDRTIVCCGGRIDWVGPTQTFDPGDAATVLDASGLFVIPGLVDANVHLVLNCDPEVLLRYEPGQYDELVLEAAQVALRSGVTTVFDTWGPLDALKRVRDAIARGSATGARIFLAGNIIGNDGPWSEDFFPYERQLNPQVAREVNRQWEQDVGAELTWMTSGDVRERVRRYIARHGIDFVKYASSAHAHFRFIALSPDSQAAIVQEAHAAGLIAQACALTPEALKLSMEAGVDLLQHANSTGKRPIPDELLDEIVERNVPAVLLLQTSRFLAALADDRALPTHWRDGFAVKIENARRLIARGARVVYASDGGVFGATASTSPWVGALLELPDAPMRLGSCHVLWQRAARECGLSPMNALLAATRDAAAAYGRAADVGSIEVGKCADLVVLADDPLATPARFEEVLHVIKDGRVVDRESLPERPVLSARATCV